MASAVQQCKYENFLAGADMKERIIEMLGQGLSATQVASAVGCDDSYISQLISDEDVSRQIQELRAENFSKYVEQDKFLDDAEARALEKVSSLVGFISKPAEAVRVFGILNAAKRRTVDQVNQQQAVAQTVSLDLPAAARVRFTLTHDKQVIEIEGRSMTTMPAKNLAARLEQRNASRLLDMQVPATILDVKSETIAEKL